MSSVENVSDEFKKVIKEFINDIINTFPEYKGIIFKWYKEEDEQITDESSKYIFNYCVNVYPERFFEILYQNNDLFSSENKLNTEFLPGISFRYLWSCNISDKTRETIWKYLQLILISLIGTIKDKSVFGETSKLLDTINEDEFKNKLEETLDNIQNMFSNAKNNDSTSESNTDFNLPTSDDLHSHISTMLHGKLGGLAKEIAEETMGDFNFSNDMDDTDTSDPQEIFKKLFSEPQKFMNLVKNVGSKLDNKMKNGDINQSELLSEATEMIQNMKNIPGMGNIQEMMDKMGMGKNVKLNKPAMENKLKLNNKRQALRKKMEEKHMNKLLNEAAQEMAQPKIEKPKFSDDELVSLFNQKDKKTPKKNKEL
jgi:hypothetical protein